MIINNFVSNFREDSKSRHLFVQHMVEDRLDGSFSYFEFLQHLKQQSKWNFFYKNPNTLFEQINNFFSPFFLAFFATKLAKNWLFCAQFYLIGSNFTHRISWIWNPVS